MVTELYGPGKPARVLLVEDDARAALELGEMLRSVWNRGLVVSHTQHVADAVQELADHGATCVLLDLHERPMFDVLEELSAASPTTPIVVVADGEDDDIGVAVVRAGAQDYLVRSELTAARLARAVSYAVERKRSEAALAQQALHDPLTALPNRALFLDRLRGALDRSRRTGGPVVVLFLDVDGFKQINDTLGHGAGDRLLIVLADRFRAMLRPMDTVARFGGDEFTFLFEGLESDEEAAFVAERITQSAAVPLTLGGQQRTVSISIGVYVVTDPEEDIDDVIRQADTAMYRAKESGGDRFEVFEDVMARLPGPRSHLERELRQAVERAQLRVHYQPRVSFNDETGPGGIRGAGALGAPRPRADGADRVHVDRRRDRADRPHRRVGHPSGARSGRTLARVAARGDHLGQPLRAAAERLLSRRAPRPEMRDGGHDPGVLCLEVAEGALEAAPELAMRQLAALNELGITLAIDDFGTGTSSSITLSELPVHILKIDTTLVSQLGRVDGDVDPVGDVVELGHALGLKVVAEGVETDAQLAHLRRLGCDGAQGFLFSQPMPEEGVYTLLGTG